MLRPTTSDRDGVHVAQLHMGLLEGAGHHRVDHLHVLARGHLGEDAAEFGVHLRLGGDHVGERPAAILDHRRSGLVTGSLNTQDAGRA
jgi:hypothetical protein